ncbi:MAG: hypothetical protein WAK91_08585 [Candidatus Acidiferrales bacterium]|jgi:hypothetical protein
MYVCRDCEQPLNQATEVCPYCGTDLTGQPLEELAAPKKKRSIVKIVVIWGVLVACLWAIVWFVLPPRPGTSKPEAEKSALAALSDLRASLASYEAATGSYPSSLETLGPGARSAAQAAKNAGYEIQYTPSPSADNGSIRNFALVARPGNYGYRNFYLDESGAIRSTRENRAATAQDPELR